MLKGQEKLTSTFENMNIEELPHTFMLLGEIGCGKHTLSKEIASKFNLEYSDISAIIDDELISEIENIKIPTLYVLDIKELKDQNIILKFIEDYKEFVYICVICDNKNLLLETIANRCVIYEFERYSKEFLSNHITYVMASETNKPIVLNICTTPGQLDEIVNENLQEVNELSLKVIHKTQDANFPNLLSLVNKFNYKDYYDKYNVNTFFKLMLFNLLELCKKDNHYYDKYMLTQKYYKLYTNIKLKLNSENLMTQYLIDFWKLARGVK